MKRIIAVTIIACGLSLVGQIALAHHSAAMFDNQKVKELTGTIKEFQQAIRLWHVPTFSVVFADVNGHVEGPRREILPNSRFVGFTTGTLHAQPDSAYALWRDPIPHGPKLFHL